MSSITELPRPFIVFREAPDGNRVRVGMYKTHADAVDAVRRSQQRQIAGLDDVQLDEFQMPAHSIFEAGWQLRITITDPVEVEQD